jgi:hypothetical protein
MRLRGGVYVAACFVTLGLCLVGAAAAAAASWAVQAVPPPTLPGGQLSSVSCASSGACVAVGSSTDGSGIEASLAERWNGSTWSVQATPYPSGATTSALNGVSCVARRTCVAVGSFTSSSGREVTLAERWSGSVWTIQGTPNPVAGTRISLRGVSCASSRVCIAVGSVIADSPQNQVPLVERWNGSRWSIDRTAKSRGASSSLSGVSCPSRTACIAVGSYTDGSGSGLMLAERWNGVRWSIQPTSQPGADLRAVSCTSRTACTAVGSYDIVGSGQVTLAERWNGTHWTRQSTPTLCNGCSCTACDDQETLNSVSCVSKSACVAVGSHSASGGTTESGAWLTEQWNGSRWSIRGPKGSVGCHSELCAAPLNGVSCRSLKVCTAVGEIDNDTGPVTLAERWNGSRWSQQHTPNPAVAALSQLSGVSCPSAPACTAVGSYTNQTGTLTLAERWTGSSWSIQTTPTPSSGGQLVGVACASTTACITVGSRPGGTLAEGWNGSSWSIQSTPSPKGATLSAVSCTSPTACTAVGNYTDTSGNYVTLAERWDGSRWSIQPTPTPTGGGQLLGVSCTSTTACAAVGSNPGGPLVEIWDGNSWSIQATPSATATGGGRLNGISCTSATACIAVGSGPNGPLAEIWDGNGWSIQNTPSPSPLGSAYLTAVSCASAITCSAVGAVSMGSQAAFAEVWDGSSWSIQGTPNPTGPGPGLSGVSCTSTEACVAVGSAFGRPFTERYF